MINTSVTDMHNKLTAKITELEAENKRLFDLWHNAVAHGNSIEMQLLDVQEGWAETRAELDKRLAPDPRLAVLEAEIDRLVEVNRRLVHERAVLLDVETTDGLTASEWVMRTAIAESKLKQIAAQSGEVEG